MTASYPVSSEHYKGPPTLREVRLLDKIEPSKSVLHSVPMGTFSYGNGDGPAYLIKGDSFYFRTSNNLFKFDDPEYGPAFNNDDIGVKTWLDAGQKYGPKHFGYVRLPQKTYSSGAVESFGDSPAKFHKDDTPVRKHVHYFRLDEWPNNEAGKAVSRIENIRQSLMRYLRTTDAQELTNYLNSLGHRAADIDNLGIGYLPERAIYGVGRTESGRIRLSAAEDAYAKIVRDAKLLGIKPEDLLTLILEEELVHIYQRDFDKDGDSIDIEIAAKERVFSHRQRLAKGADGDPKKGELKRKYQKLAAIKKFDAETTPQRYGKNSLFYKELYSKNRAALEDLLASEAIVNGYTGKVIAEYVATRLNQIAEEVEENGNPQARSRLEKIADKDSQEAETSASNN